MFYSTKRLSCAFAAAASLAVAGSVRGAIIQTLPDSDLPVSDPASVFDASRTGNHYSSEPGTNSFPGVFDLRDLFGGSFGTGEPNDVIFDDGQPAGTVSGVNVTLARPVSLTAYNLFLADDGTAGTRSAREFKLFASGQLIDDVPILDTTGHESYTSVYGAECVDISDTLTGVPVTADYTLEFIQNQPASGGSGVRAVEFEGATGTVPEPASLAGMLVSGIALCARRRRTKSRPSQLHRL